ncbi:hypothetical protein [Haladaptatus salinisoli]|uniref:hypothetical protein n=1 Tax=Haladaptatus salinisoli TaxID=2884876 RepID=UPI001D0A690D|nr:hypothetical protein [Haladaptatus salinisoli]
MADRDDDSGIRFTLPPMSLPPITLPGRIRLVFPAFERPERPERSTKVRVRTRNVVAALLVFDALDALLALSGSPTPWLRAVVGTVVAGVVVGPVGLVHLWEGIAVAAGAGWLAVVPSATLLLLARLVGKVDLVGGRHPEQVDGHAEREREHPDEDEGGAPVPDAAPAETDHAAQHERRGDVDEGNQ